MYSLTCGCDMYSMESILGKAQTKSARIVSTAVSSLGKLACLVSPLYCKYIWPMDLGCCWPRICSCEYAWRRNSFCCMMGSDILAFVDLLKCSSDPLLARL